MQVLASQLHFLANRNAGLAIPPLFWPVNCIKIGGHVALLSCPTVHSLYCDTVPCSGQIGHLFKKCSLLNWKSPVKQSNLVVLCGKNSMIFGSPHSSHLTRVLKCNLFCRSVINHTRSLDPTRPVTFVNNKSPNTDRAVSILKKLINDS